MIHTYKGKTIQFQLIRKKRKSVGISIDGYGTIEVQAPKEAPEAAVFFALEEKWEWIQQTAAEVQKRLLGPAEKKYEAGELFLYFGKPYPVVIQQDSTLEKEEAVMKENALHIRVKQTDDEQIKKVLRRFYTRACKAAVLKHIRQHQPHFKTKPRSVRITDSSRTWGTCDSNGQLTFNWKLAMAPPEVIDYVVVHEMCHMVHMNHDRSFWRLVGKLKPDYRQQEKWLARSSWKMTI